MNAEKLRKNNSSCSTRLAQTIYEGKITVASRNGPRWTEVHDIYKQCSAFPFLLKRMPELGIQASLGLPLLLSLMATCKEMYNCCNPLLAQKAIIAITFANLSNFEKIDVLKLIFAQKNSIPIKFNIYLSDLKTAALTNWLNHDQSVTLFIERKEELNQIILLIIGNQLLKKQLWIFEKIANLDLTFSQFRTLLKKKQQATNQLRIFSQTKTVDLKWLDILNENSQDFQNLFNILSKKEIFCNLHSLLLGDIYAVVNLSKFSIEHLSLCYVEDVNVIEFPHDLISLSFEGGGAFNFSTFPSRLKTFCLKQMMFPLDFSKLPNTVKNLHIEVSSLYGSNLSNLPTSLENFSLDWALENIQIGHGDIIITIKRGCKDINIKFSKNCPFPCITSSNPEKITIAYLNRFL